MDRSTNGTSGSSGKSCGPLKDYYIPDYILKPNAEQVIVEHASCCPVVVFINSGSGGQLGSSLIKTYRQLLNEAQFIDLSEESPDKVLHRLYANFKKLKSNSDNLAIQIQGSLRLIVAGGDGTVSWLLGVVSDLKLSHSPPIASVPLGTGNDLPLSFGWVNEASNSSQRAKVSPQIDEAQFQDLIVAAFEELSSSSSFTNHKRITETFLLGYWLMWYQKETHQFYA